MERRKLGASIGTLQLQAGSEDLCPGPVGRGTLPFMAAPPGHQRAASPGDRTDLFGHAGLTDAGLPGEQHNLPDTLSRSAKRVLSRKQIASRPTNGRCEGPKAQGRSDEDGRLSTAMTSVLRLMSTDTMHRHDE